MDLFSDQSEELKNLLPEDGEVYYFGTVLSRDESEHYYRNLMENIVWRHDEAKVFGKHYITKRKVAWYADKSFEYSYSNITKKALPWTKELLELKKLVEDKTEESYNACLLNLYHSGEEGMAWHSDGEKMLKKFGAIASLSLGAERKFAFKHKESQQKVSLILERGSLLLMTGKTQYHWLHRLPPTKKVKSPRINLTFRTIEIR